MGACGTAFLYAYLPETKNRSIDDILRTWHHAVDPSLVDHHHPLMPVVYTAASAINSGESDDVSDFLAIPTTPAPSIEDERKTFANGHPHDITRD
jgi:hypothetical protein